VVRVAPSGALAVLLDRAVKSIGRYPGHYNPAIELLFVCTGNQCRSPMAEVMLRRRFDERDIDARVSSVGLVGDGRPASESTIEVMTDLGHDLRDHVSRPLSQDAIERADLVLALAREHVRESVLLVPSAFGKTFTLKELVRRGADCGPRRPDEPLDAWLARVHEGRTVRDHLGSSPDDDVVDPIGRRMAVYESVADEIAALVDELVELLWGSADEPGTDGAATDGPDRMVTT
jgi:protein-tyrosine phosphatase